jgi:hypothetical protein
VAIKPKTIAKRTRIGPPDIIQPTSCKGHSAISHLADAAHRAPRPNVTNQDSRPEKESGFGPLCWRSCAIEAWLGNHCSPQIPDSPAAFLESWSPYARKAKTPPGDGAFFGEPGDGGRALPLYVCGLRKRFKDNPLNRRCGVKSALARPPVYAGGCSVPIDATS